jgi:hypothetical protein
MLASVTDPRSPQGIQHGLKFVLAVCVVATLAGAKNYRKSPAMQLTFPSTC